MTHFQRVQFIVFILLSFMCGTAFGLVLLALIAAVRSSLGTP